MKPLTPHQQAHEAITKGNIEALKTIWSRHLRHPNITHRNSTLGSIAAEAAASSQPEILEWCFENGFAMPEESTSDRVYEGLYSSRSTDICQVLIEHGVDLNRFSFPLGTVFLRAVGFAEVETVRHDVNAPGDITEPPPISEAIGGKYRSLPILKLLLAYNIRLPGTGALHLAAELGNLEIIALLLVHGADINERYESLNSETVPDGAVHTPLWRACECGELEAVKFLLEHGADPRARNELGESCYRVGCCFEDIADVLEAQGLDVDEEFAIP